MTKDTHTASGAAIQRYKIGYHADDYRAAIAYVQSHPGLARAIAQE